MQKNHILIFKGSRGNKKKIAIIKDQHDTGQTKTDQEIMSEAEKLISTFCSDHNFKVYYTRVWNSDGKTIFDVGSHTEFFHLIPAVDFTHHKQEEAGDDNNT